MATQSAVGELGVTRRERWAWYLYDVGNSAYAAVVLLAVYSAYFQGQVVGGAEGTRLWGVSLFIAMGVVTVISPVLGVIADFSASKKRFLFYFTVLSIICTAALVFAEPGRIFVGMAFFILAEIGYRSAQVFYNALLPEIAAPDEMARVSGNGWAIGTAGGILCLLIILPLLMFIEGTLIVRVAMVITAAFFAIATIPTFTRLQERAQPQVLPPGETYLSIAFKRLRDTLRAAGRFREFVKFIIAFFVYNDGTMMALDFAAIIGAVLYGMTQTQLIVFVLVVQVTNVVGAFVFGYLVDRIGGKRSLALAILIMIAVVIWLYFNQTATGFFIIGSIAGFAMAGTQSVSRTMIAYFAPAGQSAEFYGFFSIANRTSSVVGPPLFGIIAAETAFWYEAQGRTVVVAEQLGQRMAILLIGVFFLVGLVLLSFVDEAKAREAAQLGTH
jgi:UMF1 family MFS transporter